jgi:demethylmenaquinone methyltransferase/2-methoxy-6-polyprenyl-1,4-benzoquinol methylase
MRRVVKKGGEVVILEFSLPENKVFKSIYYLYFQKILPFIGGVVSKKKGAYSYLPSSVMAFPERREFVRLMYGAGLADIEFHDLTFGIVTVYSGVKL